MLTAKEGTFVARQLSLRRFHKDALCRNDEVKRRPILSCRKAAVGRCTIIAFYVASAVPEHGRLDELAARLARAEFMSLRPFGPTLSASRRNALRCLDDYFHDLRVEPVAEGEGWSTACRRRCRSSPSTEAPSRIGSISTSKGRPEKKTIVADPYELDNKVKDPSYASDAATLRSLRDSLKPCVGPGCWVP
jgi:hypothetical protein